ncbi:MAG: zinc ribbon domain-containing protein [Polyangiaceae bacterium]
MSPRGLRVDPTGRVSAGDSAVEGVFELLVNARGKSAKVTVEIASSANYDALLAKGGLNAAGESDTAAVAIITTGSIGSDGTRVEEQGKRSRAVFIAVVAIVSIGLGILAIVGVRRSRRAAAVAREAEERHAAKLAEFEEHRRQKVADHERQMKAHMESVAKARDAAIARASARSMVCPACRREFPSGSTFCPHDGSALVVDGSVELQGTTGMVCPTCRRGYPTGTTICAADREALVPYAMLAASSASETRKKICPVCGDRFEGSAEFCGKDGASLVLLN